MERKEQSDTLLNKHIYISTFIRTITLAHFCLLFLLCDSFFHLFKCFNLFRHLVNLSSMVLVNSTVVYQTIANFLCFNMLIWFFSISFKEFIKQMEHFSITKKKSSFGPIFISGTFPEPIHIWFINQDCILYHKKTNCILNLFGILWNCCITNMKTFECWIFD